MRIIAYSSTSFVFFIHCGDLYCNSGNALATPVTTPSLDGSLDVDIGSDGLPVIAYQESADISFIHCGNLTCSSSNTIKQSVIALEELTRVGMAIGSDGLPIIVAGDDSRNFRGTHCGSLDCSSGNTTFAADGIVPDVTIGSDGLPIFSYVNDLLTHSDVTLMHWAAYAQHAVFAGNLAGGFNVNTDAGLAFERFHDRSGLSIEASQLFTCRAQFQ